MFHPIRAAVLIGCALFVVPSPAHVHVQISFAANQWRLFIHDFESGDFEPAEVSLTLAPAAHSVVPPNTFTNFLGHAGEEIWTLPESESPDLLYLGIGTSGIAPGTFEHDQVRLQLHRVSGPGHFALYHIGPFGNPLVHMNSRDEIEPVADSITLHSIGAHAHVNWSFSAPGTYRLCLTASGRLANTGQTSISTITEFTFHVQDIPWRPRLTAVATSNGLIQLKIASTAGRACRIWSTDNLQMWSSVTNFTLTGDQETLVLPMATNGFFRASIQ